VVGLGCRASWHIKHYKGMGSHAGVGVHEMRVKPSSSWSRMSHSVRGCGAHSTMYLVWPYLESLCLEDPGNVAGG
jgi:hypothetical protein